MGTLIIVIIFNVKNMVSIIMWYKNLFLKNVYIVIVKIWN